MVSLLLHRCHFSPVERLVIFTVTSSISSNSKRSSLSCKDHAQFNELTKLDGIYPGAGYATKGWFISFLDVFPLPIATVSQ